MKMKVKIKSDYVESLCQILCKKNTCPEDILKCDGGLKNQCKKKKESCIRCLNLNQIKYTISSIDKNIYLNSCPGSGKTEVLGIKVAYEYKKWTMKYQGMAILTFTNSAEDEIRNRVHKYCNELLRYPHYIGTFTSWLHGYIANPFLADSIKYKGDHDGDKSIRLVESGCMSEFTKVYATHYSYKELGNIRATEYYWDVIGEKYIYCGKRNRKGQEILDRLIKEDSWREEELEKVKERFCRSGFCLYEDIEMLTYFLLSNKPQIVNMISKRFPIIFIDECQDLSQIQLEILRLLCKQGSRLHFIGDLGQAIYKFRSINPKDTERFIKEMNFKEMVLDRNYRSYQKIVDASNYIIDNQQQIRGNEKEYDEAELLGILYGKGQESEVVEKFGKLINEIGLDKENTKIIVRNTDLKQKILGLGRKEQTYNLLEELASTIYLIGRECDTSTYISSFKILAHLMQKIYFNNSEHYDSNHFYCPKEVEIKEWKLLINKIKEVLCGNKELIDFDKTWTEWKEEINKTLKEKINVLPLLNDKKIELGKIRSNKTNEPLKKSLRLNNNKNIPYGIETIHGCKGMSLDAILFMSSYQSGNGEDSGAYWKQWFDRELIEEKNRLAYVAFSRAKYLLVLGIPKPKSFSSEDKQLLIDAGFKVVEI